MLLWKTEKTSRARYYFLIKISNYTTCYIPEQKKRCFSGWMLCLINFRLLQKSNLGIKMWIQFIICLIHNNNNIICFSFKQVKELEMFVLSCFTTGGLLNCWTLHKSKQSRHKQTKKKGKAKQFTQKTEDQRALYSLFHLKWFNKVILLAFMLFHTLIHYIVV